MQSLSQKDLINRVVEKTGLSKADVRKAVRAIAEVIIEAVTDGLAVPIPQIGKIQPVGRKARNGRNPKTGKAIRIAAKVVPVLNAAKGFKELLNR